MKILGALWELPAKQHCQFEVNGLDWQCCLAGSSKTAPRIFIFSIVLGAECLSYLKSIETHARTFFKVIIFSIGSVVNFRYVSTYSWLDKLGQAALHDYKVVIRQTFYHGCYAMIGEDLNPNPDFWISALYKKCRPCPFIQILS